MSVDAFLKAEEMDGFIREKKLIILLGVSRSTLFRMGREGVLPEKYRIGARAVGWRISEINEFIESRKSIS